MNTKKLTVSNSALVLTSHLDINIDYLLELCYLKVLLKSVDRECHHGCSHCHHNQELMSGEDTASLLINSCHNPCHMGISQGQSACTPCTVTEPHTIKYRSKVVAEDPIRLKACVYVIPILNSLSLGLETADYYVYANDLVVGMTDQTVLQH